MKNSLITISDVINIDKNYPRRETHLLYSLIEIWFLAFIIFCIGMFPSIIAFAFWYRGNTTPQPAFYPPAFP